MERQAQATDRAIKKLGITLDTVGSSKQVRQMSNAERGLSRLDRQARTTDQGFTRLSRSGDSVSRSFRNVDRDNNRVSRSFRTVEQDGNRVVTVLGRIGAATRGLGAILGAFKFPAMIAGIGVLVKGVGVLGGALVALVPQVVGAVGALGSMFAQVGQLGGAAAALPATFVGIGLAMGTVKLATNDLKEAFGGNQQALKRLTPEARTFLKTLQGYQPVLNTLKATAQRGLFGGLTDSLRNLRRAAPTINALVGDMSGRLGALARQGSARFTQRGFLQDLLSIGQQGGRIVTRLGTGVFNLLSALRHVAVAAGPFTEWLSKTVLGWTHYIEVAAAAGRHTGAMARFFERTRSAMTTFGHIIRDVFFSLRGIARAMGPTGSNLWRSIERAAAAWRRFSTSIEGQARMRLWFQRAEMGLRNLTAITKNLISMFVGWGRAASTTGDSLWTSARRATEGWARFANSIGGQVRMREFFQTIQQSFQEIVGLTSDLSRGVFQLTNDRGFPALVRQIRGVVPDLVKILDTITKAFGPAVLGAIQALGNTLSLLTGAVGPVTIFLNAITGILNVVNSLIGRFPVLKGLIVAAITIVGINAAIGRVRTLAASWGLVASQATVAAAAERGAVGAGIGGGAVGGAPVFLGRGGAARVGVGGAAMETPAMGFGLSGGTMRGGGLVGRGLSMGDRVAALGGAGAAARLGLGAAGRFIWPIAAITSLFGALTAPREGNAGFQALQTGSGALSGLTMGLIPRIKTGTEQSTDRVNAILNGRDRQVGFRRSLTEGGGFGEAVRGAIPAIPGTSFFGRGGHTQHVAGLNQRLAALGGDTPRTLQQVQAQLAVLRGAQRNLRGEQSAAGRDAITQIGQQIQARRDLIAGIRRQRHEVAMLREQERAGRSRQRGRNLLVDLGNRFNVMQGARGTAAAFTDLNQRVQANLLKLRPAGRRLFAQRLLGWARANAPREEVAALTKIVSDEWGKTDRNVQIVNGKILVNSRRNWQAIRTAMTGEAERARQEVSSKFTALQLMAVGQLRALGYTPQMASAIVAGLEQGRTPVQTITQPAADAHHHRATGGRVKGIGLSDKVKMGNSVVAPGELVVNRHTEAKVNRALGGRTTLGAMVEGETRPHYMAMGGRARGLMSGVSSIASNLLGAIPGLSITSTTEGRHAANSYHYRGMAVDLGGSAAAMMAAVRTIISSGLYRRLLEGIHNPGLSVKNGQMVPPSFWGPQTWAGHMNHIHLAAGGGAMGGLLAGMGAGGGLGQLGPLRAPASALRGVPGALSNRSGALVAAAMRARINQRLGQGPPWFGKGGDFIANKPTMIGVGDRPERVTITPVGHGGQGGTAISVGPFHITATGEPGQIRRLVEHEVTQALESVARKLEATPVQGDAEVLR